MSILNWFGKRGVEVYEYDYDYDIKSLGNIVIPEKLTNKNAYILANSVAEIFFPIDFYADRISKLRFFIALKSGKEVANTELSRFVSDKINPLWNFSDLVYNYVFSYLADGNGISYLGVPSTYQNISPSSIARWDVLIPNLVEFYEYSNMSTLNFSNLNELIKSAYYNDNSLGRTTLDVSKIRIDNFGIRRQSNSNVKSEGVLWKANKSIDTLLAVYSARYNVFANNGAAGFIAKKSNTSTAGFETSFMDGNKRQEIINDIKERHGLTGRKNIFGISGIPIEFVKTMATISELMPFDETLDDAIKIAATLQIPPVLVPRKDQSTYDNQENAERNVWENGLLSMAQTVCSNLSKVFALDKIGYKIGFDSSNVSALVQNESENQDLITKKLLNLEKLKQLNPEIDVTVITNEIIKEYGKE